MALFLEQRLGKCLVAIRWAVARGYRRIWVATPKSCIGDWVAEFQAEGIAAIAMTGDQDTRWRKAQRSDVLVSTAQTMAGFHPLISGEMSWDCAILDESVVAKNPQAKVTKGLLKIAPKFKGRAILSGLPAPESPEELVTQFLFLHGEFMGHISFWGWQASNMMQLPYGGFVLRRGRWDAIREYVAERSFLARREGTDKTFRVVKVNLNDAQEIATERARYSWEAELARECPACEGVGATNDGIVCRRCGGSKKAVKETSYAVVIQQWLCRVAGGFDPMGDLLLSSEKCDALVHILRRKKQAVVWANFTSEIFEISRRLRAEGWRVEEFTGGCSAPMRTKIMRQFRTGMIDIIVAQVACAQYGCTFSTAECAAYYSVPWSCNLWKQSQDRIISADQKKAKRIYILQTRCSIDAKTYQAAQSKGMSAVAIVREYFDA